VRHIHPISGKDSLASAIRMMQSEPDLPMEYVFHDTGWELDEVYHWIEKAEKFLGKAIHRCGDDLTEIVAEEGLLPSPMRRYCTRLAKIKPMREFVGKDEFTLYLGLRADEPSRIDGMRTSKKEHHRFPLQEAGMRFEDVWTLVSGHGMLPPQFTWQWMLDRVRELGGKRPKSMPEWEWLSLFAGRSRPNCDKCFYQRQYEWVWLLETHPDRFQNAVDLENSTQDKSPFKLIGKDKPLQWIVDRAEEIKERRALDILKKLNDMNQPRLFVLEDNPFGSTSCGLFCGK
jgi:hypothetical protein